MSDHSPQYTDAGIGDLFQELYTERRHFIKRMRVRRAILDMFGGDFEAETGTHVPHPYDDSQLILKVMVGDPVQALANFASRLNANAPQVNVTPVSLKAQGVGKTVDANAAEQERLLMSMWQRNGGNVAQRQMARLQSWASVGWYLTLPRDASWGLPDRQYFDELTDEEISELKRTGKAVPVWDEDHERSAEPASSWMDRRRQTSQDQAVSGATLTTLKVFPPDQVLPRYDDDGTAKPSLKYAFAFAEIPASYAAAGTEFSKSAYRYLRRYGDSSVEDVDIERFGFTSSNGVISGGAPVGGYIGSQQDASTMVLSIFVTRDEVYYYLSESVGSEGKIIYYDHHGGGKVPLIPTPALYGDPGAAPGYEYKSLMDGIFAMAPILNQIETLLTNVATWDALGRFVIEDVDGIPTDDDGEPVIASSESMIGLQPGEVSIIKGRIRQLEINADIFVKLLEFYSSRMDLLKPSPVTEGIAGASQPAWSTRMLLESSGELLEEAVDNHADAVAEVMQLWIRWMRMLDEPIYVLGIPGKRSNERSVRGLIEFDPADLTEAIDVQQSAQGAQQRIALQAHGVELRRDNVIDDLEMFTDYFLKADPEAAEIRGIAAEIEQLVWRGASETIAPGSLLSDAAQALRGELSFDLLRESPAFAMASAEQMGIESALNAQQGNVADVAGVREPGLGMGQTQPALPALSSPQGSTV